METDDQCRIDIYRHEGELDLTLPNLIPAYLPVSFFLRIDEVGGRASIDVCIVKLTLGIVEVSWLHVVMCSLN